jgi:hypothetical protein
MTHTTTTQENVISKVDRDAFERALAIMLKHRELIYRGDFKRRLDEREEPWRTSRATPRSLAKLKAWH